ncbi:MAG: hypothetical protein R2795_05845 [Saprospiraceae bacterium]
MRVFRLAVTSLCCLLFLSTFLVAQTALPQQAVQAPKRELRAAWVATSA